MTFSDLKLIDPILRAVKETGYEEPSPIQQKAIPPVLEGRDLLGCAQTGTGKTAAFALPILQRLEQQKHSGKKVIRSLVLTPTRELALQIQENFDTYSKHLALRSTVIFGGVGQAPQVAQLRKGVDILVATPGRLLDLIGQGFIKLDQVDIFVLDEADRMLDMGFVHDVRKVLKCLPSSMQTLLFSATMPKEIVSLADQLLKNPVKVFVTPPATTVERIEQHLYKVDKANKRHLLAKLLQENGIESALVFTRTKHGADRVVRELKREGIAAMAIHGNKSQTARQNALALFKDGKVGVLVATDIAARGLDINELSHVINYDLPNIPDTYVHRIGRTGRAGKDGIAISFSTVDELPYLADIEKLIGFSLPETKEHPWPLQVLEPTPPAAKNNGRGNSAKGAPQPSNKRAKSQPADKTPPAAARPAKNNGGSPPPPPKEKAPAPQNKAGSDNKQRNASQSKNPRSNGPKKGGRPPRELPNPYENRTGSNAIITKVPVWGSKSEDADTKNTEGEDQMSRNNKRRRGGKSRSAQPSSPSGGENAAKKPPEIKKNDHGVFDFTEEELAEDTALRLISNRSPNSDAKYLSFEDYLKDH